MNGPTLPHLKIFMGGVPTLPYFRGGGTHSTPLCSIHLLLSRFEIWEVLLEAESWNISLCFHEYCPPSGPLINGYYEVCTKNIILC